MEKFTKEQKVMIGSILDGLDCSPMDLYQIMIEIRQMGNVNTFFHPIDVINQRVIKWDGNYRFSVYMTGLIYKFASEVVYPFFHKEWEKFKQEKFNDERWSPEFIVDFQGYLLNESSNMCDENDCFTWKDYFEKNLED